MSDRRSSPLYLTREDTSFNPVFELFQAPHTITKTLYVVECLFLEPKKTGQQLQKNRDMKEFSNHELFGFCEGGGEVDNIFQIPFQDLKCES